MKKIFIISFLLLSYAALQAQLGVNINTNAQQLAQNIAGTGVTVSNAVLTCSDSGSAIIDGSTSNIGFNSGILLATGNATLAIGPNNFDGTGTWEDFNNFVDNNLSTILPGFDFFDGCVLEFDVVPLGNQISFRYVFASEEYPEYVCSDFNDVFGFFISGPGIAGQQNLAIIPGTNLPVTINNVNSGNAGSASGCLIPIFCDCELGYDNFYSDNGNGNSVQYDAFTTVLTAQSTVTACETYRLKLAIADAGDGVYDSGVFLEQGSLNSNIPVVTQATNDAFEGCRNGQVIFGIPSAVANPTVINYVIGGSATNGVDYQQIQDNLTIPAGQTTATLDIITIIDVENDPIETIELYVYTLLCDTLFYDTVVITLREELPVLNAQDTTICEGEQVQLQVNGGISYQWAPPTGLSNPNIANPIFTGTVTTGYIVTAVDSNNCNGRGFVTVNVVPPPNIQFTPLYNICFGDSASLLVSGANNYTWFPATSLSNANIPNPFAFPNATTNYNVAGRVGGCADTVQVTVNVNSAPIAFAGNDTAVCENSTYTLNGSGGNSFSWQPASGLSNPAIANPQFTVTATTTFVLTVDNGCTDTDTVTITALASQPISAGNDVLKCPEDSIILSANGGSNYVWTPNTNIIDANTNTPTVFNTLDVVYTVSALDINGCETADSVLVSIIAVTPVNAGADANICEDASVVIGGAPTASTTATINWQSLDGNLNALSSNSIQNPLFDAAVSGTGSFSFVVSGSDQGCDIGADTATVIVNAFPVADFAGLDSVYCLNDPEAILTGNPTGGTFSGIGVDGNNFFPDIAGLGSNYAVTYNVTDANGCSDDTTKFTRVVTYAVDAGNDTTIAIFDSIQLNPSQDAVVYQWSPTENLSCIDCANPFASPTVTTTYTLIAIDENGCAAQDNVTVEVFVDTLLWLPNAFTPDGDGINDVFMAYGKNFKTIDFKIFNRWGELLFVSNNPLNGWDGTYKGKEMNPDSYVYTVKATYINYLDSKLFKGTVVLIR